MTINNDILPSSTESNFQNKLVSSWTNLDVYDWLNSFGFFEWSHRIAIQHKIDGPALLLLNEDDLRLPPLSIDCLGDIKRIFLEILKLQSDNKEKCFAVKIEKNEKHFEKLFITNRLENGYLENFYEKKKLTDLSLINLISTDELIRRVESPDTKMRSFVKLVIAFIYCSISLLITSFVMVVVHDRVPNMKLYPPLPDIVLDNIPLIPWAFECCEIIGLAMSIIWFTILVFHKHRIIILRRVFCITGTIFLLRCVTMLITSLSVPGIHLECRAVSYGNLESKLKQAFHIWSHLGMSIQGVRTCGDYMFSGHTATITLLNHFITEYTPDSWRGLHTLVWTMNIFGVFFILAGHEHYSIDVFIAFYITSRMFLSYHANAYNYANMTLVDSRVRVWFPLGWFFESGVIGRVENVFDIPYIFFFKKDSNNNVFKYKCETQNAELLLIKQNGLEKCMGKNGISSNESIRKRKIKK